MFCNWVFGNKSDDSLTRSLEVRVFMTRSLEVRVFDSLFRSPRTQQDF